MKNLLVRSLTGIVFVSIILICLFLGRYTYLALFLALLIGGMHEFFQFFGKSLVNPSKFISTLAGIVIFLLVHFVSAKVLPVSFLYLIIPVILITCLSELFRKTNNPLENIAISILGIVYVAMPFSLTNLLVFQTHESFSPKLLIALFVIIWIYDSFAYLFGISFGKHRLFERISPKKSWEGAIGGTISALVATYFMAGFIPEISKLNLIIITFLVIVFSTFGDLTESLFKRQVSLKDSSSLFPGHGGVLDRFDSLLFAAPIVVFYMKLFM